jgi:catechol 2,3-dioxygenase
MSIPPDTSLGAVRLTVADLDRTQSFYESAVGLRTLDRSSDSARLGVEPDRALVELVRDPDAAPRPAGTTGLYHLAVLVPSRVELARALRRVAEAGASFTGASDHLVSEALYLNDPEGNGIEIYRDRPREEWRYVNGTLQMATEPLDVAGVLGELAPGGSADGVAPETRIGHVHLQVADLGAAEEFYAGTLGFEVTIRGYPGALFLAAGGYHHHVGLNTWAGEGAPSPPPGARGLRCFEVVLRDAEELARVSERIAAAGLDADRRDGSVLVADPSGNRVLLTA